MEATANTDAAEQTTEVAEPTTPPTPLSPSGYSMHLLFDAPDLLNPDEFSDVSLLVDGQTLYTCKGILASASPVWRRMFVADFKEKGSSKIPLPGKSFTDIHELLLCISPAIQKPIASMFIKHVICI